MSFETLRGELPDYAGDLAANLCALAKETALSDQQKWGAFTACAHALGEREMIRAVAEEARGAGLSEAAARAAKSAAALMAMNNVYYRALSLLSNGEYRTLPVKLRMHALADPGVDKLDFELWCAAVSALHGCGACLDSHETELKRNGVAAERVQAALRIAAVVAGVSGVLRAEAAAAD